MPSGDKTGEVRPRQDVGVSSCRESTEPRLTATEVFSFAASFGSNFISQSSITAFLSQPLLTELFESTVSPGLALPGLKFMPLTQKCNSTQRQLFHGAVGTPTALLGRRIRYLPFRRDGHFWLCVLGQVYVGSVLEHKGWDALHFAH